MENNNKKYIALALRVVVAFLFLISAVAKLYPSPYFAISTFEVKSLYPMGFPEGLAAYFSRFLIGTEFALGILLLQPNYLRRFVIPATIAMLVVFIIHLSIDTVLHGGNSGNCGCFGTLLPMTPVQAIIKNIIAVALLVWLLKLLPKGSDGNKFWVLLAVEVIAVAAIFIMAPIAIQAETPAVEEPFPTTDTVPQNVAPDSATLRYETPPKTTEAPKATATAAQDAAATPAEALKAAEPAPVKSVYSQYFPTADKGKKIICMFVPGCEHCRDAAKQLTALKAKDKAFPEIKIIFMDEEADLIPEFFKVAGAEYPYKIMDVIAFWKLLGNSKDTPGVIYLWNGNIIKDWNGINDKKFVGSQLQAALKKPYTK